MIAYAKILMCWPPEFWQRNEEEENEEVLLSSVSSLLMVWFVLFLWEGGGTVRTPEAVAVLFCLTVDCIEKLDSYVYQHFHVVRSSSCFATLNFSQSQHALCHDFAKALCPSTVFLVCLAVLGQLDLIPLSVAKMFVFGITCKPFF